MASGGALVRLNFSTRPSILAADALAFEALIFDPVKGEFIAVPLTVARGARSQRLVTTSPIVVGPNDQIINCNINAPAICALPLSATRSGIPLSFKDVGRKFNANNLTLTTTESIDGQPSIVLNTNGQFITLVPANDGITTGWFVE